MRFNSSRELRCCFTAPLFVAPEIKTKKFCDGMQDMGLPGFDLAVYKDGQPVLRYIGGYSDLENRGF